jgi:hypothetical protein
VDSIRVQILFMNTYIQKNHNHTNDVNAMIIIQVVLEKKMR